MVNGGGGAVHREVQAEWKGNTGGHEVGRALAMVLSLHKLEWREGKGEERGFARRGGVRASVSPKEKNRRGSGMGMRARIESRLDARKRGSTQCTSTLDAA